MKAFRTLTTALLFSLPLLGSDPINVKWNQVCQVAGHRELQLTTAAGEKVEGVCVSVSVDEISVRTSDKKVVKLARQTLSKLEVQQNTHQLRALGKSMHRVLRDGVAALFSPLAPAGLVMIPGTLAWGVIATPFCILGDIGAKVAGTQEINPI